MSDLNHTMSSEPFHVVTGGAQLHLIVHDEDEDKCACITLTDEDALKLVAAISQGLISKWERGA